VPSLFPFAVLSAILIKTGGVDILNKPLYCVSNRLKLPFVAPSCFVMAIASGYPAGSRIVTEFFEGGAFDKRDAEKLAFLCSTSGPLFIIGSVGSKMFANSAVGLKIFVAHTLSILLISLIFCAFSKRESAKITPLKRQGGNILHECFFGSASAMLNCGAFICFFYTVAQIAYDLNIFYPVQKLLCLFFEENICANLCKGLIEATGACVSIAQNNGKHAVALCGFLITFGGASIIFQQLSYLVKAGIKPAKFVAVKLIQAVVCFIFLLFLP